MPWTLLWGTAQQFFVWPRASMDKTRGIFIINFITNFPGVPAALECPYILGSAGPARPCGPLAFLAHRILVSFDIHPATIPDIAAIERIVASAYALYVARIGATPGPMLDDYSTRVARDMVHVLETQEGIQATLVLIPEEDCLLLESIAVSPGAQEKMTGNIGIYTRYGHVETHRAEEMGLKRVFMKKAL